ncbi:seryl-tRNA(Ala) deacylase [Arcobacter venerupis]|uniref:Seryl-tRNA(Ala) deacylase n=2 Tax=Arcobacter venerupis TaxID=1054033 RepID=A0AAE7B9W3_9BACT|nr:alanyl-tRNA editing protein [Arcobacter venerupis]QKF66380.1 seryl-tRNA(Ala) deacylase [Arcobacter venerupis]RWS50843.1 alanyl-tRNA editing protein [Arcobacter venerupis]
MSNKLFWENPYQTELHTKIKSIVDNKVELEETIFYAESGGQESDTGTINGFVVEKAEKSAKSIFYTLESDAKFAIGQEVLVKIDWNRRYNLMRLHFAAEVVLELFYKRFTNLEKIGAHISDNKSRIDFELSESVSSLLPEIQAEAQSLIDADFLIESSYSDEKNERRYWKVENFAQVSCGGTHLKRTSEVGKLTLKRKNIGKGKERIEIFVN